nr:hypothetical protein [Tanacetum cinerariifolium]
MLLAIKDEAGGNLNNEENDFMLDNHYRDDSLEELNAMNVQKEAKNQCNVNNELKRQKASLQKELETCKEWVKTLEKQPIKSLNYKEAYEELEQEIRVDKDKIDNLIKEKDKIQDEFFQLKNATVRIRHETELSKRDFNKTRKQISLRDCGSWRKTQFS